MSRRSVASVRSRPIAETTAVVGEMRVQVETLTVQTSARLQVIDLTDRIAEFVQAFPILEGAGTLVSMHTTCAVLLNEFQTALVADYETFLKSLVGAGQPWRHNDPELSDCDRGNTGAHLQALLVGHSVTFQVSGREVVLGQWQRILLAELDGPRPRTLRLSVMGVA